MRATLGMPLAQAPVHVATAMSSMLGKFVLIENSSIACLAIPAIIVAALLTAWLIVRVTERRR